MTHRMNGVTEEKKWPWTDGSVHPITDEWHQRPVVVDECVGWTNSSALPSSFPRDQFRSEWINTPDLFRVEVWNQINFWSGINPSPYHNVLHRFIIPSGLNSTEANKPWALRLFIPFNSIRGCWSLEGSWAIYNPYFIWVNEVNWSLLELRSARHIKDHIHAILVLKRTNKDFTHI
jgi:hypothetical protein